MNALGVYKILEILKKRNTLPTYQVNLIPTHLWNVFSMISDKKDKNTKTIVRLGMPSNTFSLFLK